MLNSAWHPHLMPLSVTILSLGFSAQFNYHELFSLFIMPLNPLSALCSRYCNMAKYESFNNQLRHTRSFTKIYLPLRASFQPLLRALGQLRPPTTSCYSLPPIASGV